MVAGAMGGLLQEEWNLPALVDSAYTAGHGLPWCTQPSATFGLSGPPAYRMVLPTFVSFSIICD